MKIFLMIAVACILILLLKISNREHYTSVSELQTNYEKSKQNCFIFLTMRLQLVKKLENI